MRKSVIYPIFASSFIFMLSACGGGGSETEAPETPTSTSPPPPAATLTVNTGEDIDLAEQSSTTTVIDINYTGSKSLNATITDTGITALTTNYTLNSNTIELETTLGALSGKETEFGEITITISDGSVSDNVTVSVTALNTSFTEKMVDIDNAIENASSINVSKELSNISLYLADKAYLYGIIDDTEKRQWVNDMNAQADSIQDSLKEEVEALFTRITEQRSTLTETELESLFNDANTSIAGLGDIFTPVLQSYASLSVPNFTTPDALVLTLKDNESSLFYGNTTIGSGTIDNWTFFDNYEILSRLLPRDTELCIANNEA